MRSERKHAGDRGKRPAAFYDRYDASRRARFPYRDFTFRGSALVFAAATWKSRTSLLLVAVAAKVQLYDLAPLRGTLRVAARKHRRRKTPDRRYNSEGTLLVDERAQLVKSGLQRASCSLRVRGINDRGLGNCVFNLQASALRARTCGEN